MMMAGRSESAATDERVTSHGRASDVAVAVLVGMLVAAAGTIPRNLLFLANLRYRATTPWAVPVAAVFLYLFWRYVGGDGPPQSTVQQRREALRANRISVKAWMWSLGAGFLGLVALVLALRVANRNSSSDLPAGRVAGRVQPCRPGVEDRSRPSVLGFGYFVGVGRTRHAVGILQPRACRAGAVNYHAIQESRLASNGLFAARAMTASISSVRKQIASRRVIQTAARQTTEPAANSAYAFRPTL